MTPEDAFPRPGEVPAARLHELNQQALDYYRSLYPHSWGPDYLRHRLGTDLTDHSHYAVGYAPGSGQSLIRHLTTLGATLDELDQAGLVSRRRRDDGTTYYRDAFRDRLILPIWDPQPSAGASVLGFVGRRNPTKSDADYAGPKYLNTRTTAIFTKGDALFGHAGWRGDIPGGALPVIVEGPLDAIAITVATRGTAVGVAPLGTALTVNQVRLLRSCAGGVGNHRVAIAMDADAAGWVAAQRAFWHLNAADIDPDLVVLPEGSDPAQLLETGGREALRLAVENRTSLGDVIIHELVSACSQREDDHLRDVIRQAARITGARAPHSWPAHFGRINAELGLEPGVIEHLTISESMMRDQNRLAYAQARISELHARPGPLSTDNARSASDAKGRMSTPVVTRPPEHEQPPAGRPGRPGWQARAR